MHDAHCNRRLNVHTQPQSLSRWLTAGCNGCTYMCLQEPLFTEFELHKVLSFTNHGYLFLGITARVPDPQPNVYSRTVCTSATYQNTQ